jgi:hypothetical protein
MMQLPSRTMKTVALLMLAAGCLPRGPAPMGQHLLTTRDEAAAELLPTRPGQPRRVAVWQEGADGYGDDLYVAELSPTGVGPLRLLADKVDLLASSRVCDPQGYDCQLSVDQRGRILLRAGTPQREESGALPPTALYRVDLATGSREDLGVVSNFEPSPGGARLLIPTDQGGTYRVIDADGQETVVQHAFDHHLIGDSLFYLADGDTPPARDGSEPPPGVLKVLLPDRTATRLAEPVSHFELHLTSNGPVVILIRPIPGSQDSSSYVLLDPITFQETPLDSLPPRRTDLDLSPDGLRVVLATRPEDAPLKRFHFIDRQTGASDSFGLDAASSYKAIPVYWRPGRAGAWIVSQGHAWAWRAGGALSKIDSIPAFFPMSRPDLASPFTDDGAHCLLYGPAGADLGNEYIPIFLADADAPDGPRLRLNPPGTGLKDVAVLDEDHLLVSTFTTFTERRDLQVFDTRTGVMRPVASGGVALATDSQRALAMLRVVERPWSGDLTLIDIASGAHTVLGENVTWSLLEGERAAPLGSGARVIFVVRGALASPYDGVWMATLP